MDEAASFFVFIHLAVILYLVFLGWDEVSDGDKKDAYDDE